MAPSAWDKAYFEKNLVSTCKAFSKAAVGQTPAPGPSHGTNSSNKQAQGLAGMDELNKVLSLLKALLSEAPPIISKALCLVVREQLLGAVCAWLDRVVPITMVELAAGLAGSHAPPLPHQTNITQALTGLQRLLRILTVMLRPYTNPGQLQHANNNLGQQDGGGGGPGLSGGGPMFAAAPLDLQPLDRVLSRVLHPMVMEAAGRQQVHPQYRHTVLGSALNMATALASLALQPALRGSTFTTCVLEGACTTELLPSMAGLLAHAAPSPAPGQSQDKWYEGVTGSLVELLAASRDGPAAVSATFQQGWQRATLAPMVQELLLERLIHGLRDASPSGLECPPGFDGFGLLPGRCCVDDTQLLRCLQLCLDAQWLAWRAAQETQPQGSWGQAGGGTETVLEPAQLFELTRQVAEQAVMVVAEDMAERMDAEGYENEEEFKQATEGEPKQATLAALQACASCLSDMQWLWPGLPAGQQHTQLPLVLALAANTLAFASQGLEASKASGAAAAEAAAAAAVSAGRQYPRGNQRSADGGPSVQGGAVGKAFGNRAFGRGAAAVAPGAGGGARQGNGGDGASTPRGNGGGAGGELRPVATLRDCFVRATSMLSFFFPVHREGAALVGQLSSLYSPQSWAAMSDQASGAIGALEMALRGGHADPTPAIHIMLLHALAGVMQAAPGSYWTHQRGAERAGLVSTLRKVANNTAGELEANVAAAQQLEREILSAPVQAALGADPLPRSQAQSVGTGIAARAARAAADAVDRSLQQRVDFIHRLIMLVVDGNALQTAPTAGGEGAPPSFDPDFTGVASVGPVGSSSARASWQGRGSNGTPPDGAPEPPSPSVLVVIPASGGAGAASGALGPQGRRGRGDHNPDGQAQAAERPRRVSEAQLQLRAWALAELLPAWLRLWAAQLAALALAVQAEALAEVSAVFKAARVGPAKPHAGAAAAAPAAAGGAEAARYQLMRTGMEWLTRVVGAAGPLCASILSAHALHVSPAGPTGRNGQLDSAVVAVAKSARQLVAVLTSLDTLEQLAFQVQLETRRLGGLGVPEGQAGVLRTMVPLLTALVSLPGGGRVALARGALEHKLAGALAVLYDEQRRLGGRAGAAAATMDALQVVAGAVEEALSTKPAGGGKGSPAAAAQVAQARKMLGQLHAAPPPSTGNLSASGDAYTDDGFDAQACALVDVLADESLDTLRLMTGPAPALDGVLAGMALHVGCCHPRCGNLEEEGEHLLQLHLCQGCMRVRYCSRACQLACWVGHQEQCKQWSGRAAT